MERGSVNFKQLGNVAENEIKGIISDIEHATQDGNYDTDKEMERAAKRTEQQLKNVVKAIDAVAGGWGSAGGKERGVKEWEVEM